MAVLALAGTLALGAARTGEDPAPSATGLPGRPSPAAPSGAGSAPPASGPIDTPPASPPGSPAITPSPAPPVLADVAIVPVTSFRSARTSVTAADLEALAGGASPFRQLVLVERDADAILAALGLSRARFGERLRTVAEAADLPAALVRQRRSLAFLRADEVGPSVRALAWGQQSLFGADRVRSLERWRLTARLGVVPDPGTGEIAPAYDPADAWTLVAAGDILLDRGVSLAIREHRRGADFPFDGGTVEITGRCRDCSPMGWDLPRTRRTGNAGAVRDLLRGADLAIANFENPAPDRWRFHPSGTSFSANPAHIAGLARAGIDWVSLANNHIGDAGRTGMLQTMANLDEHGIRHGGLGEDREAAHRATLLEVGGVTVGLLGYDRIAGVYRAREGTPGSARMTRAALRRDIKAARRAGAEVVVVYPHWGLEYRARPTDGQRDLAHAAIDAGADMVIGNHAHWAAGMEVYRGRPIWYALGNFVFDQTWSEYTMEGLTLELTFRGVELVQVRMRPHLILDRAQPNFLDPAGSGAFVMDQVWEASEGLLPW